MATERTEVFVGGTRERASAADVQAAWEAQTERIPASYALGTAKHESDFTLNEVDTEPSGYVTKGIFQLSDDEARRAGRPSANLLTLDDSAGVMAYIAEKNTDAILRATGLSFEEAMPDLLAYLFIAHNQGLGRYASASERKPGEHPGALGSIADYGLDWEAYKERNPNPKWISYGDDVISGGGLFSVSPAQKKSLLTVGVVAGALGLLLLAYLLVEQPKKVMA